MAKATITPRERLQLIGLLTLAGRYSTQAREVETATKELLGVPEEDFGHVSDAIYDDGSRDADRLLSRLNIVVLESE